jgi:hypothetical protein
MKPIREINKNRIFIIKINAMQKVILYWFKIKANKAAKKDLTKYFNDFEIKQILHEYWQNYLQTKPEVPAMPTLGGSVMVHLAAMSTAFYLELIAKGKSKEEATQLFYDIAWQVYVKMGRFSWWLAGINNRNEYKRVLKATQLFRAFPFNSPSYKWKDVEAQKNVVGFDCLKCPVAEYFQSKSLSEFCTKTWCALDYPLAELWHAKLKRTGTIAGGADKCDFRWDSE